MSSFAESIEPGLKMWPVAEQRELQEKDFIRNLVEQISDQYEKSRRNSAQSIARMVDYAVHLTEFRASLLVTELERIIRFKCVNLPSSMHDMHLHEHHAEADKMSPGGLIAFLMQLLGDVIAAYVRHKSTAEFKGQPINKRIFPRIMSTIGGTALFLSQFQPSEVSRKMVKGCGGVVTHLCHLCPAVVLSHVKVLLDKCLSPESEEKGIFYMLRSIQFLDLKADHLEVLFADISWVIKPPEQAWKRTAMLELNMPLRTCILRWIKNNPHELRALYECADSQVRYRSKFEKAVRVLLVKMEPWEDGSKKRSAVWPTVCLLLCLVPNGLKEAIADRAGKGSARGGANATSIESRLFRRTLDHLNPDLKQIMFRNRNAHLFSELSVISLVLMAQAAAALLRAKLRVDSGVADVSNSMMTQAMVQRGLSYDSIVFFIDFMKKYNLEKLQDGVLCGNVPSSLYHAMVTGQGNSALSDASRNEEFTPASLLIAYSWSINYLQPESFYHLAIHILKPPFTTPNITVKSMSTAPNKFHRLNILRSIELIIQSIISDGGDPNKILWCRSLGLELVYCVLSIIERFVSSSLSSSTVLGCGSFGANVIHKRTRAVLVEQIHASCHVDVTSALPEAKAKKSKKKNSKVKLEEDNAPCDCTVTHSMLNAMNSFDCGAHAVLCLRIISICPSIIFISRHQHVIKDFTSSKAGGKVHTHMGVALGGVMMLDSAMFRSADLVCVCMTLMDIALCVGHELEVISLNALSALLSALQPDSMALWDVGSPIVGVINISSVLLRTFGTLLFSTDGPILYSKSYRQSFLRRTKTVLHAMMELMSSTNSFLLSHLPKVRSPEVGITSESNAKSAGETNDEILHISSAAMLAHYLAVQTVEAGLLILVCSHSNPSSEEEADIASLTGHCLTLLCDRNNVVSYFSPPAENLNNESSFNLRDLEALNDHNANETVWSIYRSIAKSLITNYSPNIALTGGPRKDSRPTDVASSNIQLLSQLLSYCIHRSSPLKEGEAGMGLVWAVQGIANRWKYVDKKVSFNSSLPGYVGSESFILTESSNYNSSAGLQESSSSSTSHVTYGTTWGSGVDSGTLGALGNCGHFHSSIRVEGSMQEIFGDDSRDSDEMNYARIEMLELLSRIQKQSKFANGHIVSDKSAFFTDIKSTKRRPNNQRFSYFGEWVRDMGILAALSQCLNICPEEFPQFDAVLGLTLAAVEERTTEEDITAYMNLDSIDLESFLGESATPVDNLRRIVLKDRQALQVVTMHELCSSEQLVEDLMNILIRPICESRVTQSAFMTIGAHISSSMILTLFSYMTKLLEAVLSCTSFGAVQIPRRAQSQPTHMVEAGNGTGANNDVMNTAGNRDSSGSGLDRSSHPLFVDLLESPLSDQVLNNIKDLSFFQIVGFLTSSMMILLLIFDRDTGSSSNELAPNGMPSNDLQSMEEGLGSDGDNNEDILPPILATASVEAGPTQLFVSVMAGKPDYSHHLRESADFVEIILTKIITTACKAENETVSGNSYSAEFFILQKKIAYFIESIVVKKKIKLTKRFRVFVISILLDWVYRGVHTQLNHAVTIQNNLRSRPESSRDAVNTLSREESLRLILSVESACITALEGLLVNLELSADTICMLAETASFSWINTDSATGIRKDSVDHSNDATEGDVEATGIGPELTVRSKVFYRFFHVLSAVFTNYGSAEKYGFISTYQHGSSSGETARSLVDSILSTSYRSLANILHANMDVGFHHLFAAASGVAPIESRVAMMEVFVSVLGRMSGEDLTESRSILKLGYEHHLGQLLRILFAEDKNLLTALCYISQGKEAEILSRNFLVLFEEVPGSVSLLSILKHVIFIEIYNTEKMGTLFRSESLPTKLVNMYMSVAGKSYLIEVLQSALQSFIARRVVIDIDSKTGVETVREGLVTLQREVEVFLESIYSSVRKCPPAVRILLKCICDFVAAKFGASNESVRVVVAGSLFLRFFCPAIALPSKHGIDLSNDGRDNNGIMLSRPVGRGLLLIAKVLQHIVNCTKCTEEYLLPMNDWIDQRTPQMISFCVEIANYSSKSDVEEVQLKVEHRRMSLLSTEADVFDKVGTADEITEPTIDALSVFHAFLFTYKDSILAILEAKHENDAFLRKVVAEETSDKIHSLRGNQSPPRSILKQSDKVSAHIGMQKYFDMDWATVSADADTVSFTDSERKQNQSAGLQPPLHDTLANILDMLGEPSVNNFAQASSSIALGDSRSPKSFGSNIDEYLRSIEAVPGFAQSLEHVKNQKIVYVTNQAKASGGTDSTTPTSGKNAGTCVLWFVLRRVDENTRPPILMYVLLKEAKMIYQARQPFDLVFDCTLFGKDSVLQDWSMTAWWNKLRLYVSEIFDELAHKIYVVHPSLEFVYMARKILKTYKVKTRIAGELCDVVSVSELISDQPLAKEGCPYLTRSIADGIMYRWPVVHNSRPSSVAVSGKYLVIETPDTFGGKKFVQFDTVNFLHVISVIVGGPSAVNNTAGGGGGAPTLSSTSLVPGSAASVQSISSNVSYNSLSGSSHGLSSMSESQHGVSVQPTINQVMAANKAGISPGNPVRRSSTGLGGVVGQRVTISYMNPSTKEPGVVVFQTNQAIQLHSMLSAASAHITQQTQLDELSAEAGSRPIQAEAIPGSLLQVALLNLSSSVASLRKAGYSLLCALKTAYSLEISVPLNMADSLYVPQLSSSFVAVVSQDLSVNHPDLAIEFNIECVNSLLHPEVSLSQKYACLQYLKPWIATLSNLMSSSPAYRRANRDQKTWDARIDCLVTNFLNAMLDVTLGDNDLGSVLDQNVWQLVGQQDALGKYSLLYFLKRMCEHSTDTLDTLDTSNSAEWRLNNIDPLLHNAYTNIKPAESRRNQSADNKSVGTSPEEFLTDEFSAENRSISGGPSSTTKEIFQYQTIADLEFSSGMTSPLRINANIRQAMQSSVLGSHQGEMLSTPLLSHKMSDSSQQWDDTVSISKAMNCMTNLFTSIALQQNIHAASLLCNEIHKTIMKISILTHSTGLTATEPVRPAPDPNTSTPQKRAADIRPMRMRSSPVTIPMRAESALRAHSAVKLKRVYSNEFSSVNNIVKNRANKALKKKQRNSPSPSPSTKQLPFYSRSFESSSSDEDDNVELDIPRELPKVASTNKSTDAVNYFEFREPGFEKSLSDAKLSDMPNKCSSLNMAAVEAVNSGTTCIEILNDTEASNAKDVSGFADAPLNHIDNAALIIFFGSDKCASVASPPLSDVGDRARVGKHELFWLRANRVNLNKRISTQNSSIRERLVSSWCLPFEEAQDACVSSCDIDSLWSSAIHVSNTSNRAVAANQVHKAQSDIAAEVDILWNKLTVLLRTLIPLLFQSGDLAIRLCADLFHVIISCLGRGSRRFRFGTHTLACNVIHAMLLHYLSLKDPSDKAAKICDLLAAKLALFNSQEYRFLFCLAPLVSVQDVTQIVKSFAEICINAVMPCTGSGGGSCRGELLQKNLHFLCALCPAPSSFRHVAVISSIMTTPPEGVDVQTTLSCVLKSLGVILVASDGESRGNVLLDSILKSLCQITSQFSDKLLRNMFWFALVLVQLSSDDGMLYPLDLLYSVLQQISSRKEGSSVYVLLEDELLSDVTKTPAETQNGVTKSPISGRKHRSGTLLLSNQGALFDLLTELSDPELLGVPLLSNPGLSFALSTLLVRSIRLSSRRELGTKILSTLENLYSCNGGTEKYGVSGYACALNCILEQPREFVDENSILPSDFPVFDAVNFPSIPVAVDYVTFLLSLARHLDSPDIKIRVHRSLLQFIEAMPVLSTCLHELIFAELSTEFENAKSASAVIISRSIDACLYYVLPSHPVGKRIGDHIAALTMAKKPKENGVLFGNPEDSPEGGDTDTTVLPQSDETADFSSLPQTVKRSSPGFTTPPASPAGHVLSNQSTPVADTSTKEGIGSESRYQQLHRQDHQRAENDTVSSPPLVEKSDVEVITESQTKQQSVDGYSGDFVSVTKQFISDVNAFNAVEAGVFKTIDQMGHSAGFPARLKLVSIACDFLRLSILEVEHMIHGTSSASNNGAL